MVFLNVELCATVLNDSRGACRCKGGIVSEPAGIGLIRITLGGHQKRKHRGPLLSTLEVQKNERKEVTIWVNINTKFIF